MFARRRRAQVTLRPSFARQIGLDAQKGFVGVGPIKSERIALGCVALAGDVVRLDRTKINSLTGESAAK